MSTTEIQKQPASLKAMLASDAMKEQFAAALPQHLTPDRFVRVAITALTRTPKLQECTQESFFKCLLDLSAMGLEPDGRRAHLIPYRDNHRNVTECTLILDYKGLVELVRRSGDVAKIHADVVCENDIFDHGMGEVREHTYDLRKDRGKPYAAYAQVTLKDGSIQAEVMPKKEIEAIRKRSRAGNNGPWVTDWNEMAKKTAFRRLTKWLTLSPEVMDAVTAAEKTEFQALRNVTPDIRTEPINPLAGLDFQGDDPEAEEPAEKEGPCKAELIEQINGKLEAEGLKITQLETYLVRVSTLSQTETINGISEERLEKIATDLDRICKNIKKEGGAK